MEEVVHEKIQIVIIALQRRLIAKNMNEKNFVRLG